jgi:acyl transferase domain-containing protein/thioesterase domain-containing protein/acyl carrier protein
LRSFRATSNEFPFGSGKIKRQNHQACFIIYKKGENEFMNEPLAIIGIACRLPGGADSPEQLWQMLCEGTDAIREIPPDRWSVAAHYDPVPGRAGKSISKWGGFIEDIDQFDSAFFQISAREAAAIDPQQRLLLEASWEALEDGGQTLETIRGSSTGVFVGISTSDYAGLQNDIDGRGVANVYSATGTAFSIAANRISYSFDLRGPSMAMDTACSSALTACHVACQSLWRGDCTMAIVAGVNALLNQNTFVAFSRMSMLSPDGRCKAFDASANGFVRAEGVGAIVLKPLFAAQADHDRIYAVIRGTAANQDGRTNGITVPSRQAQEALIRQACVSAGVSPAHIGYVEAHGTGTPIGDPIEAAALSSALCQGRKHSCPIGSVKTNIGHLEAASGIASLIKVALVLKHKAIPPSLHFNTPNPNIDFEKLKLRVVKTLESFPEHSGSLLAGINSFGFGGANAHVILEAAPPLLQKRNSSKDKHTRKQFILPISAHSQEALGTAARNYRALLSESTVNASALCAAAATRRSHFAHRLCLVGSSRREMLKRLDTFVAGGSDPAMVAGEVFTNAAPVFVFSGQGPQWWGMGRELLQRESIFRKTIEECDELLREFGSWSLIEELSRDERSSRLQQTEIAQPAIFALQVALAALWKSWGVKPAAVVGHSVGEVAAAHLAGALTLREAARVIFHRGRCMSSAPDIGRMLAANLDAGQAEEIAASFSGEVAIAAFNSPKSVTFSGAAGPLEKIASTLESAGVFHRFLHVHYAFHSQQMDATKSELFRALGNVETSPVKLPLFSTVTGQRADGCDLTADYWWRNVRQPVRFSAAISNLIDEGHRLFLELSAHPALTIAVSETLADRAVPGKALFSLRRKEPEVATMLTSLSALHVAGAPVDWKSIFPDASADISLPVYPWQRERHWSETSMMRAARLASPTHPFLTSKVSAAEPAWNTWLDLTANSWLKDHRVQEHVVFPGAGYVEAALGIGTALFKSLPLEVEDIEFQKALFLPEGKEPIQMQSAFSPADATVRFSSHGSEAGSDWTLNAAAKVRAHAGISPPPINLKRLQVNLRKRLAKDEVYLACEQHGFFYGPMFRSVESVWRSDGEALGRIGLPEQLAEGASQFQIHPALLDACFQVAQFAASESSDRTTFLPARIDRMTLFARPGKSVFCHAKLIQASAHSLILDFQVSDETGRVLFDVEGYRAQAVRGMSASRVDDPENWLYETRWVDKPLREPLESVAQAIPGTWLIFADRSGVGEKLASLLKERGGSPKLLFQDKCSSGPAATGVEVAASLQPDLQPDPQTVLRRLLAAGSGNKLAGVLHLWSLDAPDAAKLDPRTLLQTEAAGCHSVLHLVQSMALQQSTAHVWLVTRGAQAANGAGLVSVAQAPMLGIGRTIMTEFPQLSCRLVDLNVGDIESAARLLLQEVVSGDGETEVAWRGKSRLASRLVRTTLASYPTRASLSRKSGYQLLLPASGVMDDLALHENPRRKPGRDEVEIEICAAALNFRDVMKLLGIYPMESDLDMLLGDECSGRIVGVGNKVKNLKIGDEVMANGCGCFSSHLTVPAPFVVRKPSRLTFEEAAATPVAFMTAWYALHHLGRIQRGEKILIHSATGGVGLAAIQIARLAGAEVFATAGNEEKRSYLRKIGIRHVMDSRTTAFAGEVRSLTNGAGVDLVLNSLAGDAIEKGLSVLGAGGRFLEIGKRDIYANTAIGLRPFRNNLSMFVIDMGRVMADQPDTVQTLLQTIGKLFSAGKLKPLPHRTLPVSQASSAFRLMAQAKHIGKIVLTMQDGTVVSRQAPAEKTIAFSPKASYLITGGLGGFGLAVAKWLVENGAKNLALTGRSGASTPEAKRAVAALRRLGAKVLVVKADIADEHRVARVLAQVKLKLGPLRGVFHAAMVLDDGLLTQLTGERFARVMSPKVTGGWNLHRATAKLPLDHFVMFSSVSALIGTAGQANYAAANCFLDALAHHRRVSGLPALTVNWGALGEVGVLARNTKVAEQLALHGVHAIAPAQATEMLGRLLQSDIAQIGFMHIDWERVFGTGASSSPSPRFSELLVTPAIERAGDGRDLRSTILSAPAAEKLAMAAAMVGDSVARVLRTNAVRLETNRPLKEMGLDSLMAFELLNRLEGQFGVSLPASKISASSTINSLAAIVLESYGLDTAKAPAVEGGAQAIERKGHLMTETAIGIRQLLTLRTGGTGAPLFFIHPAGGGTNIYDQLAAQLPEGFPVYGIQSRMLAGAEDELPSVEEMARSYADLIATRQPNGAVQIAGFSAGGLFALATARSLEQRGKRVSFVAMIETPVAMLHPDYPRELILQSLIAEVYDHLAGEGSSSQREAGDLSGAMMELAKNTATAKDEATRLHLLMEWLARQGVDAGNGADSGMRKFFAIFIRHLHLVGAAKLEAVLAPVFLWRAGASGLTSAPIVPDILERITNGEFTEEILEGRHFELMHPPRVKELAARLADVLAKTEGTRT